MRDVPPSGTFGAVMSLGILSVALGLLRLDAASVALLALAGLTYIGLLARHAACGRGLLRRLRDDIGDPRTAFGHLTFPAASNVLASRVALAHVGVATVLFSLGAFAWLVLMLVLPGCLAEKRPSGPPLRGSAFLAVVATQSCAVAISALYGGYAVAWAAAGVLWCAGLALYAFVLGVLGWRFLASPTTVSLDPSYGLTMGALAISTLAALLLQRAAAGPFAALAPPLLTAARLTWTTGGALMVLLVVAWGAKAIRHGLRPSYQVSQWSIVFPLGMYGVSGMLLSQAASWQLAGTLARVSVAASLSSLVVVVVLLVRSVRSGAVGRG